MTAHTIGIVGGYGATGSAALLELSNSAPGAILVGGRDTAKAEALAARFGDRVSAARVDVLDSVSLDEFCGRCSTIVNCGGPVMALRDRVAQAAFRRHCNYVDVADLSSVRERMRPHAQEAGRLGLAFIVSAGWMPGMTEIVLAHAHEQARTRMEVVESLTLYFGDSGRWSESAFRDTAWYLRQFGLPGTPCFHKGRKVRARLRQATPKVDLGSRLGTHRYSLFSSAELDELGHRFDDCDVFTYTCLPSLRAAIAAAVVALLPLPEKVAMRSLRNALKNASLRVGGFAVVRAVGRSRGRTVVLTDQIVYDTGRDYWMNGLVVATAARMIAEGATVRTGVHFLADAVEPVAFLAEVRKAGVEHTMTWTGD